MLNKVMLIGRLGADPEIRYTQKGDAVANFRLATNETWRDRSSGQRQERTEWHNVVAFGPKAEFAQNYLRKGKLIYVEGRLRTRDWTDNNNVRHFRTEINADNIQFLERASDSPGAPAYAGQGAGPPRQGPPAAEAPGGGDYGPEMPEGGEYLEDDIPF